ncbi:MAG: hypothetical protein JWQ53_340 [Klenkia sp.]|nr:hypothetical protein [Klenkia sp.]
MTSPDPPQDPNAGWQQTPGQPYPGPQPPAYGQQPASGGPAAPGGSPTGVRPPQVTGAAIAAVVIGALGTLGGLLNLAALGLLFEVSAVLGVLVLASLVIAVAVLVGGVLLLRGADEKLLLNALYASIALNLVVVVLSLVDGSFQVVNLLGFLVPLVIVFLLRQPPAQQYLAGRRAA